jgi:hypothetical protein
MSATATHKLDQQVEMRSLTHLTDEKFVFLSGAAELVTGTSKILRGRVTVYSGGTDLRLFLTVRSGVNTDEQCRDFARAILSLQDGCLADLTFMQEYAEGGNDKSIVKTSESHDDGAAVYLTREYFIVTKEAGGNERLQPVCQFRLDTVGSKQTDYVITAETCGVRWNTDLTSSVEINRKITKQLHRMADDIMSIECFASEHGVGNGEQ